MFKQFEYEQSQLIGSNSVVRSLSLISVFEKYIIIEEDSSVMPLYLSCIPLFLHMSLSIDCRGKCIIIHDHSICGLYSAIIIYTIYYPM